MGRRFIMLDKKVSFLEPVSFMRAIGIVIEEDKEKGASKVKITENEHLSILISLKKDEVWVYNVGLTIIKENT
jgi:hypothetical protein